MMPYSCLRCVCLEVVDDRAVDAIRSVETVGTAGLADYVAIVRGQRAMSMRCCIL